jgi:hypothetical protein
MCAAASFARFQTDEYFLTINLSSFERKENESGQVCAPNAHPQDQSLLKGTKRIAEP